MNNETYGRVLFILSHYTEDVVIWLKDNKGKKGFYNYIYEKIENHYETLTPSSHYVQLVEMINLNTQQEAVKQKTERLIEAVLEMYKKRR